jgi:hypothetical protein
MVFPQLAKKINLPVMAVLLAPISKTGRYYIKL